MRNSCPLPPPAAAPIPAPKKPPTNVCPPFIGNMRQILYHSDAHPHANRKPHSPRAPRNSRRSGQRISPPRIPGLWRPRRPCRHDGRTLCPAPRMAVTRTLSDLVGAVSLLPGPSSTELAIYLGEIRAGLAGLIVAGACFILPAAFLVLGLAWAYLKFGTLPQVSGLLFGIKPVVVALVAQAVWNLGKTALRTLPLVVLALVVIILAL